MCVCIYIYIYIKLCHIIKCHVFQNLPCGLFFRKNVSFHTFKAHMQLFMLIYLYVLFNSLGYPFYLLITESIKKIIFQVIVPCENIAEAESVSTTKETGV